MLRIKARILQIMYEHMPYFYYLFFKWLHVNSERTARKRMRQGRSRKLPSGIMAMRRSAEQWLGIYEFFACFTASLDSDLLYSGSNHSHHANGAKPCSSNDRILTCTYSCILGAHGKVAGSEWKPCHA